MPSYELLLTYLRGKTADISRYNLNKMQLFGFHNHIYIKLAVICVCVGSLNYIVYTVYGGKLFSFANDFSNYLNTPVPDPYTVSVRNALRDLKPLRLPVNSSLARPFLRMVGNYRMAPHYNLSLCIIEKAMCTILQNIFCYLFDAEGFTENNHKIAGNGSDFWGKDRWCWAKNEIYATRGMYLITPYITSTLFMIRSPIERFLSAFINKCVVDKDECFGCGEGVLCVVEAFHAEIMRQNREHWDITIPSPKIIPQSYVGRHMAPSSWQCDLYDESDKAVFVKYGESPEELNKTFTDLARLFEATGVEKYKIDYILNAVKQNEHGTPHATKQLGLRDKYYEQIRASPKHVQLLNDVYYYDNQIFGFEPLK